MEEEVGEVEVDNIRERIFIHDSTSKLEIYN